jgi:hypothetical protein
MTTLQFKIKKIERRIMNLKRGAQEAYGRKRDHWPQFTLDRYEELKGKARELRAQEVRA